MKTNEDRFNQIKLLEEFEQRCLFVNEQPYIDGIFGYKIKVKGRKYDVILTDIVYDNLESKDTLVIPDIFNKIQSDMELSRHVKVIDFGNIESLPYCLCIYNQALEKVIGRRVYNVGYKCFYKCKNLKKIEFPLLNSVKMRSFESTRLRKFIQPKVDFVNYSAFINTDTIKKFETNKLIDDSYKLSSGIRLENVESIVINSFNVPEGLLAIKCSSNLSKLKELIIKNFYPSSLYDIDFYLSTEYRHIRVKHLKYIFETRLKECLYLSSKEKKLLYKYSLSEVLLMIKYYDKNGSLLKYFDIALLTTNVKEMFQDKCDISTERFIYIEPRFKNKIRVLKILGFTNSDIKEYIDLEYKYLMEKEKM